MELDSRTVRPLAKDIRGQPSRGLHSGHPIGLLEPPDAPRLRFELVPDVGSFDYSPDGSMIVYESTSQQIYVRDITRGESRSLQAGTG